MTAKFEILSNFRPAGDQPQAIDKLVAGFRDGRPRVFDRCRPRVALGVVLLGLAEFGLRAHEPEQRRELPAFVVGARDRTALEATVRRLQRT